MYKSRPCRKSKLFWPSATTLALRIRLNSWSIWQFSGVSMPEETVSIARSKNGELRERDETVASSGMVMNGKK